MILAVRAALASRFQREVIAAARAAAPGKPVYVHAHPDPRATGANPGCEPAALTGVRRLAPLVGGEAVLQKYRKDGPAAIAAFEKSGRTYDAPQVLVLDYMAAEVLPDGSSIELVHTVQRAQSDEVSPESLGLHLQLSIAARGNTLARPVAARDAQDRSDRHGSRGGDQRDGDDGWAARCVDEHETRPGIDDHGRRPPRLGRRARNTGRSNQRCGGESVQYLLHHSDLGHLPHHQW